MMRPHPRNWQTLKQQQQLRGQQVQQHSLVLTQLVHLQHCRLMRLGLTQELTWPWQVLLLLLLLLLQHNRLGAGAAS
jgi:hypothetical protein